MTMLTDPADIERVVYSYHSDPFAVLGMHLVKPGHAAREETDDDTLPGEAAGPTKLVVRAFHPYASKATVIDAATHQDVAELTRVHGDGFFEGEVPGRSEWFAYRLRLDLPDGPLVIEDPYRFPPVLGDLDTYLLGEGTHLRSYERLGAHPVTHEGVPGTSFALWAPNAERVSVVGDFNGWDGRIHQMRSRPGIGVWEIFLPGVADGASYKFEIKAQGGTLLPLKADPYAFYAEHPPRTASIVHGIPNHDWQDDEWMATRGGANSHDAPISIYEVHLGSWKRVVEDYHRYLSYRELADDLVPYVKELGFTHIELLPVSEHPFDGSWGYQPIGLYASTSRFGKPEELQYFIDQCHRNGIGVLVDWVPGHFPTDEHGLGLFDGTHLYEHADPRQGFHQDWSTLIYNFGRREVGNFLLGSALYWMDRFHIDGLRVDAVASMLYLDYSRKEGEWVPNQYGGNENLEAIAFLKRMNELVFGSFPGATTAAEESTAWPAVSRPIYTGGLGFGYKWNMGWMHDTLRYMSKEPVHRRWHHNDLTFGLLYAFSENFILPLSHDEVVHGKGSLIGKMSGDDWQKFATLRSYYAFMWSQPGKKLLFMGGEFAQWREWDHNGSLDWHLLEYEPHKGMQTLIRDLNYLYRSIPALHQLDNEPGGFEWVEPNDVENSVISYIRKAKDGSAPVLIACNFTPVVRRDYRVGVPEHGYWREIVNTDAALYGGSDVGNSGGARSVDEPSHGRPYSVSLTMPPLATVMLRITDE